MKNCFASPALALGHVRLVLVLSLGCAVSACGDDTTILGSPDGGPGCGDGVVAGIEECDDGNLAAGDGCSPTCQFEGCGDGFVDVEAGETCDDGGREAGDGCAEDCTLEPVCGNGVLEEGEGCDDGNDLPLDGCSQDCTVESLCGNLVLDAGEECDDGNRFDGDGCSMTCMIEPFCGDGTVDPGESCDDGNDEPGDGCDPDCMVEPNTCGDGVLEPWAEECDDGNVESLDGCSATCTAEATCAAPIDIFATTPVETGLYVWSGDNRGASDDGSGSCESRLGGRDRVFLLDPPVSGRVRVTVSEDFSGTAILHAREVCDDLVTQVACRSGNEIDVGLVAGQPVFLFVDAPVSAGVSDVGDLEVEFAFSPQIGEGETCVPTDPTRQCASPLLCAEAAGGGFTCQRDVDIGCGVGVPVVDLPVVDGVATFAGDTTGGPAVIDGSCASGAGAPQRIFRVELPYDANVTVESSALFDHVAFARTACTAPDAELACADSGDFGLTGLAAGSELFVVVGAWGSGRGAFSGEVLFQEILGEGDACDAASLCAAGTVCAPAAGGGRTCQADVDLGCGINVPVVDLDLDPATGAAAFRGNTSGGSNVVDGSCSSSFSGRPGGPQRIYRVTAPADGNLNVVTSASFDHIAYALSECTDETTELACSDPGSFNVTGLDEGDEVFVVIDAWSTSSGSFSGTLQFQARLDLGDTCRITDLCPADSVCAPAAGGGRTCQADVDLGCGLNVLVIDVPVDPATNTASFSGSTVGGSRVIEGSCGSSFSSGPERIFKIDPPFDGTMIVDSSASFDHILYASDECTEASELACSDPGDIDVVVFAGTPVYLVADAWFSSAGAFEAEVTFERALAPGDACTPGDACPSGTICAPDDDGDDVCRATECGDGVVEGTEECDDGGVMDGDRCSSACEITPICGDGFVDPPEECDDGNVADGDGCSATCTIVFECGDRTAVGDEECDDGNDVATDGCDECVLVSQGEGGDDCDDAVAIRWVRFDADTDVAYADGTTAGAGADLAGFCGLSSDAPDRVFSFTLDERSDVVVTLDPGSGFDGSVYLRGGMAETCGSLLGEIDCRDGSGAGSVERVAVTLPAGTYYVVVDGSVTSSGAYELFLTASVAPLMPMP